MLMRETREFMGVQRGLRKVAAHQPEQSRVDSPECERADMRDACCPRPSVVDKGQSARDVAQRPKREREERHRRDTRVLSEAEGQIVVAAGLEQGERAFQMLSRVAVLSSEPMGRSCYLRCRPPGNLH
jgi:hypothetical protein